MSRRPALWLVQLLALLLVLKEPSVLNVALNAAGWVLTDPAGVWVIAAALVVALACSAATSLRHRAVYVPRRWAW